MEQISICYENGRGTKYQVTKIRETLETGGYRSLVLHIYSGVSDSGLLNCIVEDLRELFPQAIIVGTVSAGEIAKGRLIEKGILISALLFKDTDVKLLTYSDIRGSETLVGKRICEDVGKIEDAKAVELLMTGTEFSTRRIFTELHKLPKEVQVFGGYAGGHDMNNGEHFIFDENGLTDNKIFTIVYAGKNFHIDIGKSVGWQTLGYPFKVTKADENRLIEINGKPAVEVYEKYLSIRRDDRNFAEDTFEFPLIVEVENDELLRHTIEVDEDGTLVLAGYVTEGMDIYLCYGNPSLIIQHVNKRLEEIRSFAPEAILLYSCSVRKSFWEGYVDMEMLPFQQMAETAGFYTWGEVKRNPVTDQLMEYNITLLSIAMREGEKKKVMPPEVKVDDSVLKGQASLIKRLSQLVSATTAELQKAYANIEKMNGELKELSEHDALTGLYNRRIIEEYSDQAIQRAKESGGKACFVMFDIDYFKRVNDDYGHKTGDNVLTEIAALLKESIREYPDAIVGRWGGEEFFVVISGADENTAENYAQKLRRTVEEYRFTGVDRKITISLGGITATGEMSKKSIFKNVDHCLYEAKNSGRNRYVEF